MRLRQIEEPKGVLMRIAYWATRRNMGKVLTSMKVLFPRMPGAVKLFYEIQKFETKGIKLEPSLHFMIATLVSQINGCNCCVDITRSMAIRENLDMNKFNRVLDYRSDPLFTKKDRAALAYVEEATRNKRVSDETFEILRQNFGEGEIVEITWLNAVHNYYNLINIPLGIESDGLCSIAEAHTRSPLSQSRSL